MNSNNSNSSPNTANAPPPRPDPAPIDPDRYKVGAELEGVTPAAGQGESVIQPRANRATTAKQPPRSMCFMVENCPWCRPETQPEPRSEAPSGRAPPEEHRQVQEEEEEESPAANALRECLEALERDRLRNVEAAGLVRRCLHLCGKGV